MFKFSNIIKRSKKGRKVVKQQTTFYDVNEQIRAPNVIVIDESGNNLGLLSKFDAIKLAREKELDLVLVSPNGEKPVARIVDFAKFKYEKSKKQRKSKSKTLETKEWWFKPTIGDRDMMLKLEKVKKFVDKGGNAKLTVKYVPRTAPDAIKERMTRLLALTQDVVKPISEVTREGRNLSILVKSNN